MPVIGGKYYESASSPAAQKAVASGATVGGTVAKASGSSPASATTTALANGTKSATQQAISQKAQSLGSGSSAGISTPPPSNNVVQVQANGSAPKGLSAGTTVKTAGGDYLITAVNPDGTYQSQLVTAQQNNANQNNNVPTVTPVIPQQTQNVVQPQNYAYNNFNGMTQQQYMDYSKQIANANAVQQYDATLADLKSRVAQIVADQNLAKQQAQRNYQTQYSQNEGDRYNAQKATDQTMVRRGLNSSGIDEANDQATQLRYDMARQGIDIAKQNQMDTIQNEINKANTQESYDENKIMQQKAAYLSGQDAQAFKDYNDYAMKVYGTNADNFWKGVGANQANQGLLLQQQGQNQNYNLQTAQMQNQSNQFNATYNQNNQFHQDDVNQKQQQIDNQVSQFNQTLKQNNDQFLKQFGLDENKFNESVRQYNTTMQFNEKQLAQEGQLAREQMANAVRTAGISASAAMANLNWEKEQFNAAAKSLGMNPQLYNMYTGISDNVMAQIKNIATGTSFANGADMVGAFDSVIKASNLPLDWQINLQKVVKNSYTDPVTGGNLNNPSGPPGTPIQTAGPNKPIFNNNPLVNTNPLWKFGN
jgi:hypothetical protein